MSEPHAKIPIFSFFDLIKRIRSYFMQLCEVFKHLALQQLENCWLAIELKLFATI